MSKVLVDRELLENCCDAAKDAYAASLLKELEAILDKPAEAEGVDFGFDDRSVKVSQEAYSIFLARERHHLTALSAVTAERDRLLQELAKSETNTMALMVKHFAGSMSSREQDRTLDECLSEGIAMLEAERDQYRDMAGCMDLLRRDLIEAGIVGESCPPMFMTEGVLAHIAKLHAEVTALQANASRYAHLKAAWDDDVLISYLDSNVHPSDWDRVIDAAMAAKEA